MPRRRSAVELTTNFDTGESNRTGLPGFNRVMAKGDAREVGFQDGGFFQDS